MRVDRDKKNIGIMTGGMGHYAFPDPGLFVTPTSAERKARFVESWLRARAAWLLRIRMEGSLAMSSQMWRDFLATDVYNTVDGDKRSAVRRRQILDKLVPPPGSRGSLAAVKARNTLGEPMVWEGRSYPPGSLPPDDVVREILWELYQLNFAYEFLGLDVRMWQGPDNEERRQRSMKISTMLAFPTIPKKNNRLADDSINFRLPFLLNLVDFMRTWPGAPSSFSTFAIRVKNRAVRAVSEEQLAIFEDNIAVFYTQSFFNTFGRAAQIPHRLYKPAPIND